jgi:triphosphoribosyl-dephospho-CoA synthetase
MDVTKVIKQHKRLCNFVSERRIKQSLDILADMITSSASGDLRDEYDNIVMTYRNMLTYTIDGINDPERSKIYLKLIQSILTLSDRIRQDILSRYSGWHTYWVKQQAERKDNC